MVALRAGSAYVDVLPRVAKGFADDIDRQTRPALDDVGKKAGGAFSGAMKSAAAAAGGLLAAGAVSSLVSDAVAAASDLSESVSKANVVFGDSSQSVRDWAKGAATSLGQTQQQALEAAGTFGNFFSTIGLGKKEAADMSKNLVGLATDLGSFNNADPSDVIDALGAALRGEAEPMSKYGVLMNDATLKAQALKDGLIKTDKEGLTPAIKSQAAYALILEQTKTAQGDFARTSDGLAGQQKILAARVADLKTSLGTALLPVVTKLTSMFADLAGWWLNLSSGGKQLVGVVAGLAAAIVAIVQVTKVYTAVQAALNVVLTANPIGLIVIAVAALVAGLVIAYKKSETFRDIVDGALRVVGGAFSWLVDVGKTAFGFLADLFLNFTPLGQFIQHFDTLKDAGGRAFDFLKDAAVGFGRFIANNVLNPIVDAINLLIKGYNLVNLPGTKDLAPLKPIAFSEPPSGPGAATKKVEFRADGGDLLPGRYYMTGERGPELLKMGAAGGRVFSNDDLGSLAGAGGAAIHIDHLEVVGTRDPDYSAVATTRELRNLAFKRTGKW